MKRGVKSYRFIAIVLTLGLVASTPDGWAQTRLRPGFNLFSIRDDVEIGRRSAAQVERQYHTYDDPRVTRIGKRLAARSSMPGLPWRFRVIDRSDVNAFALPGGYVYVTSGMLRAVRNDDELAGVLAHEITHVTLRHGTNQASKALIAQMPLEVLSGQLGGGLGANLARLGIGFGLNSLFLRYSREAETQADVGAVQLMRRAGYNPYGLASFMRRMRGGGGFFSDHPSPTNRVERIEREIRSTGG
ncbi:M48 family metallopeptidase [Pyrinomonas methylaliphatogenes]|jgi:predicted Zn-dependent protease|uniref:Peptidase family M48 n=1 Tax=Pyrinomonas methylaliphatogenes TaxID=454194 RepID=A0A0B6WWA5_9BACT|nr:M48 family metallopeptidase [Pyrinomonas methylaliphatogenes]CDM64450.1 Peptidase family M48 [Pyrinomonas methylaliphatogenes]